MGIMNNQLGAFFMDFKGHLAAFLWFFHLRINIMAYVLLQNGELTYVSAFCNCYTLQYHCQQVKSI